uniref:LNR domain-containing protein n=1 Tax=Strigamia maritima TaxID=126957 RepID=T1IXU8_STRMM
MLTMTKAIICKLLQRRTYDILSQKYSFAIFFLCLVGLIISGFRFGEVAVEWSIEKHSQIFSTYQDNIMGKSYQHNLCQHLPIDVVYTWVNGTDPKLLRDLVKVKLEIEEHLNDSKLENLHKSSLSRCTYSYCLESHVVILRPRLPEILTLKDLSKSHFIFNNAKKILPIPSELLNETSCLGTIIVMESKETANLLGQRGTITVGGLDYTISLGLITTDSTAPYSIKLKDTIIMTGVPGRLKENDILRKLPLSIQQYMEKIFMYSEVSAAVMLVPDETAQNAVLKLEGNFSIQNREQSLSAANLLLHIPQGIVNEDVSTSRFQDNEELRYSLRSLEKFAPWVRQIFIVTNGQIPSWLNLENPRVTVVSHDELYPDKSHLPTFSSPSIETHLHQIPGLSKKFLYLNDDVVFGKPVWPEDFYTSTKGHKVYLSWAVPDCRDGCPSTWIGDGYCDKPCNNTDCEWDGNDCKDGATGMRFNSNQNVQLWREESDKLYCSANCANSWLADRYCDQACNVLECAYDTGDCGTTDYNQLYRMDLSILEQNYTVPSGIFRFYFNLTEYLSDRSIKEGSYEESTAIRVAAINQKFKIITIVLFRNQSTTLSFHLKGVANNNMDYELTFSVIVDTYNSKNENYTHFNEVQKPSTKMFHTTNIITTTTTAAPTLKIVAEEMRHPKIKKFAYIPEYEKYEKINVSAVNFPQHILNDLNNLHKRLEDKFLTDKGYRIKKSHIIGDYIKNVRNSNQTVPEMIYDIEKSRKIEESIKLRNLKGLPQNEHQRMLEIGAFPWEKKRIFYSITQAPENIRPGQRHLLDTFGDSLRHVNRLLNKEFGYESRKVPAHMAHMMDVDIITDLQARFPKEFEQTSSNKIRSTSDMQFAFSFFYFVMSEKKNFSMSKIFDIYDTDNSGTWSDREIRTVLSQLNDLPISYESVETFERIILNCSNASSLESLENVPTPRFERYLDSKLVTVTKDLVLYCSTLNELFKTKYTKEKKYKFEIVGEEEVAFKMIKTNISHVIAQLDDIRKRPRKFICLNDDIDHAKPAATMVKTILIDFYESFYPIPSQFELSREYRNRFLTIDELKEWRRHRDLVKRITYACLLLVIIFLLVFLFRVQIRKCFRWCKPRRKVK